MQMSQVLPTQASIRFNRLDMLETGTYNLMYSRPNVMTVSGDRLQDIVNRVAEAPDSSISPSLFGGIASSIIMPSVHREHEIAIPNGWAERRLRFLLYVDVMNRNSMPTSYIFQGFTSHLGVGMNGSYDPNMEFIINSFVRLNNRVVQTPQGMMTEQVVSDSYQLINGQIISDQTVGDAYKMRPMDLFTGIQTAYLQGVHTGYGQGTLQDTRGLFMGDSIGSRRSNCLPSNYLSSAVTSYQTAKDLLSFGQDDKDLYARAGETAYEQPPTENPFIRQLSHVRARPGQTRFTLEDLKAIDPGIQHVTNYRTLGPVAKTSLAVAGSTQYWHQSTKQTVWASLLSNAVPAIMMESMLGNISFFATNDAMGGQIVVKPGNAYSLTNGNNVRNISVFLQRLEREILRDLCYEGDLFYLNMTCSIYGDSSISLKINHEAEEVFTTPSFCDSLLTPVYTSNNNSYNMMVSSFEGLMNELPTNSVMTANALV